MRRALFGLAGAIGLVAALLMTAGTARAAEPYAWCATYGGGKDGVSAIICGFDTLQQCRETVTGLGGWCQENPIYPERARKLVKHPRKRHRG